MILLNPYEEITVLTLSGGIPKKEAQIKNLALLLGPDFMQDEVTVETSDHARLGLRLAYKWHFRFNRESPEECERLFNVRDFVGDACKAIASRIRGAVSSRTFEDFHKNSTSLIRLAVFGKDKSELFFKANQLVITNIDIKSIEPIEEETRKNLMKTVNLAFEIQTRMQEAHARHEAAQLSQESNGELSKLKIQNQIECETVKKKLYELQAQSKSIQSTGMAIALAKAKADASLIEVEAEVIDANAFSECKNIESKLCNF